MGIMEEKGDLVRETRDLKIRDLERQLAALKSRWPAPSVPPAMIEQLDELEEELKELRQ
jgi:hypothetical protein